MAERVYTIASDILEDLQQTSDDRKISLEQVVYWVLVVADRLRSQRIAKQGLSDQARSGHHLRSFLLDIQEDTQMCERYVVLPERIYDYELDGAIDCLFYYQEQTECEDCPPTYFRVIYDRTTRTLLHRLGTSGYQAPNATRPLFYRLNDRLYLHGQGADVVKVIADIFTTLPRLEVIDPMTVLEIDAEDLYVLKRHVLDLGRYAMLVPREDLRNDGTSGEAAGQAPPKMVSVNDQNSA